MNSSKHDIEVNLEDFEVVKVLGSGNFSTTYEAICTINKFRGEKYALKRYFLSDCCSIEGTLHERNILVRLASGISHSPFVASLFWAFGSWMTPCCVCTLGSGYNLGDVVKLFGHLKEEDARFYIAEVMCGLQYIHEKGIVHRDIKLENILLSETGHVIITDFDLSYDCHGNNTGALAAPFAGTPEYMAPEIANNLVVTKKADVWSLGALTIHLVSPNFHLTKPSELEQIEMAKEGTYEISNAAFLSIELVDFIKTCLRPIHTERPEVLRLRTLPFFSSINWKTVSTCRMEPPFRISQIILSRINTPEEKGPILRAPPHPALPTNVEKLKENGFTEERIQLLFRDFSFVHPSYNSQQRRMKSI